MKRFLEWLRSWLAPAKAINEDLKDLRGADDLVERSLRYKAERDELLKSCKLLLLVYYGHIPGPFTEHAVAMRAEDLVEKADGRRFDSRAYMLELARTGRLEE